MKYSFDILKSRLVAGLSMLGVMLVPIFLFALLHAPALRAYIPDFLYRDLLLPIALQILAPIYIIYNKRQLFWKNVDVTLDTAKAEITIDGGQYSFDDLEYYELVEGSLLTSGDGRYFIILKFKHSKKIEIIPCRTSERVANYDAFAEHFLSFVDRYFEEDKEKGENKTVKRIAVFLLIMANVSFIVLLFLYGKVAAKIIPAMLTVYGVCLPLIFKRKRTRKGRINSHNKV